MPVGISADATHQCDHHGDRAAPMDWPVVRAVDSTPEAVAVLFSAAFANISLLFGGRKKPYPMPHSAMRHRRSSTLGCAGSRAREPSPGRNRDADARDLRRVEAVRQSSGNGAHRATVIGQGVKTVAETSTL